MKKQNILNLKRTFLTLTISIAITANAVVAAEYHEIDKEVLMRALTGAISGVPSGTTHWEKIGMSETDYHNMKNLSEDESWVPKEDKGVFWSNTIPRRVQRIFWPNKGFEGMLSLGFWKVGSMIDYHLAELIEINVDSSYISNAFGLSVPSLKILSAKNNSIKYFVAGVYDMNDISSNALEFLDISYNNIINHYAQDYKHWNGWMYYPNLKHFNCMQNKIERLDLTKNPILENLNCSYNEISELELNCSATLERFRCNNNFITDLDLSNYVALKDLYCNHNLLTSLLLDGCTKLEKLDCSNNRLTSLSLGDATNLQEVNIARNSFRFSTMPILPSTVTKYYYMPQDTIYAEVINEIDLSSEYEINGNITVFEWFEILEDGTAIPITLPNNNGVFALDISHKDKRLRCRMTNATFPDYIAANNTVSSKIIYEAFVIDAGVNVLEQMQLSSSLQVYPNPATAPSKITANIMCYLSTVSDVDIGLYDFMGQKVLDLSNHFEYEPATATIHISFVLPKNLSKGSYFLVVRSGTETRTRGIIVK